MSDVADFSIEQLGAGDLARFRAWLDMFGREFEEPETYSSAQPGKEYAIGLLQQEYFIPLAAIRNGEVIGGAAVYELKKFEQERSELYIYDLAVDQKFRRMGIATALIEKTREIAKKRNAHVIFVQADEGDNPAIGLYSKNGIRENVLHFDIFPKNNMVAFRYFCALRPLSF